MHCPDCGFELVNGNCIVCAISKAVAYDANRYRRFSAASEKDKDMHSLEGILQGISIDATIDANEVAEVVDWCERHSAIIGDHQVSEIIAIIRDSIQVNQPGEDHIRQVIEACSNVVTENSYYDAVTADMQRLQGLLHGILSDNEITDQEIIGLMKWMNNHRNLVSNYPYDEIHTLVSAALRNTHLTADDRAALKWYFSIFVDCKNSKIIKPENLDLSGTKIRVEGICATNPPIRFDKMAFCFTGKSSRILRSEFVEIIASRGATFHNNVVHNTDYLIIGDEGNPSWAFSCYGRKVEKAVNMRKSGHGILLVHEADFWNAIK